MYYVKKKDGREVPFDSNKIISAVTKSAERVMVIFTDKDHNKIIQLIQSRLSNRDQSVDVPTMHKLVEMALDEVNPSVAQSYRSYRNYKQNFVGIVDKVHRDMNAVAYRGDKSNSNTDSKLVTTQRSIGYGKLNDELYKQFFLNPDERQAAKDGYIYIHDRSARLDTMNCVLLDIKTIFEGGFEMGNLPYTDPHTVDVACDVLGDVIMAAASSQYGGLSVRVDDFLAPYCQKSFDKYYKKYFDMIEDMCGMEASKEDVIKYATKDVIRELEQGLQGLEIKLNSVASSRGDYPFVSFAFGLDTSHWGRIVSETALRVRMGGQGKEGFKRPVLFPKLIFLYDENLHGSGGELEELFNVAIECSSKCMYPDFLSLTGEGYVPSIYKKYGKIIYPMGCRAFLSPWYERGGINPADENDVPVFTGRFNVGAITLNLIMILAKAREEGKDFYEVLDYYLEMIRKLHLRTYDYLGNKQASISPITYCEGGFYGGHLNPSDKIAPVLKSATASFGITGLNELNVLYNGKTIAEDGQFPLEVMEYINRKVSEFKEKDQRLYAIYGTPAESLCFHGDTLVQTYEGNKKIKNIVAGDLVYSFNEEKHKVELNEVIYSGLTKKNAKLVKIVFDNKQEVICTPDHPFAVRKIPQDYYDGKIIGKETVEYIKASELVKGMRIKSNYIHRNKFGRPSCSIYNNGRKQLIQDINAEYKFGIKPNGYVTHHINENIFDNRFCNLKYMKSSEHRILHLPTTIGKHCFTSKGQSGTNNSFYNKKHTKHSKLNNRKKHIKRTIVQSSLNGDILHIFECLEDTKRAGFTDNMIRIACKGKRVVTDKIPDTHYYNGYLWYFGTENCLEQNHKVVSVVYIDETADVYDITVKNNHNFFVGGDSGLLVHNCGLQIEQFRAKYGIIDGVSSRSYTTNSFHCWVGEDIDPIQKQDIEYKFWNLFNGGKIQYVRYPIDYNIEAMKTLVRRAMKLGYYEGINMALSYCNDCGHQELNMEVCPICRSENLTKIDRMNGYLSYSRVKGDTMLNEAKMAEIRDRKSM